MVKLSAREAKILKYSVGAGWNGKYSVGAGRNTGKSPVEVGGNGNNFLLKFGLGIKAVLSELQCQWLFYERLDSWT